MGECKINNGIISLENKLNFNILFVEVTKKCNLKCIHCFNRSGEDEMTMSVEQMKKIVNYYNDKSIKKVILSGGEIFLLDNALEIIKLFYDICNNLQILTNGTYINDDFIKYANDKNISMQVTLNGHNHIIDNQMRGNKNAFYLTLNNIRRINGLSQMINSIKISYTISKINYKYIKEFIDFCIIEKIKSIQFSFVQNVGRARDNWSILCLNNIEKFDILTYLKKLKESYVGIITISFSGIDQYYNTIGVVGEFECSKLCEEIQILTDGKCNVCSSFETYLECRKLPKIDWYTFINNEMEPKYIFDDKCFSCSKFRKCAISCVQKK